MEKDYKGTKICAVQGDITKTDGLDVLVIGADESLYLDSGVCKAIHSIAGPELLQEVKKLGGCKTGEARITGAYNANADFIIHTAAPKWQDGMHDEVKLLSSCYKSILTLAAENKAKNIGLPSLGTGVYHFPLDLASETAINTTKNFVDENAGALESITWILFDEQTFKTYEAAITAMV